MKRRADERGAVLVLTSLYMVVMIGTSAIAIDLGNARQVSRQAQTASDAAALAGSQEFRTDFISWPNVVNRVKTYTRFNYGTQLAAWNGCSDSGAASELGAGVYYPDSANSNTCISADSATSPTKLRVRTPAADVQNFFGSALGQSSFSIARSATALLNDDPDCIICVLGTSGSAFEATGAGTSVTVTNVDEPLSDRGISVNSNHSQALRLNGAGTSIRAPSVRVVGDYTSGADIVSVPVTGVDPVDDPLALLAVPTIPAVPTTGSNSCSSGTGTFAYGSDGATVNLSAAGATCTIQPGLYKSVRMSGAGVNLTMQAGLYYFTDDDGIEVTGAGGSVTGDGVTLYMGCSASTSGCSSSGESGAGFKTAGAGAAISLSPPSTGPYAGLTIFYDRNNTANMSVHGAGGSVVSGTIYGKSASMALTGAGFSSASPLNSLIIVKSIAINGAGGAVNIAYDRTLNVTIKGKANLSR